MDKKMWEQEYPQMPEGFHLAVKSAVEQNLTTETVKTGKKRRHLFLLAAVLMTGMAAAMGVTAARKEQKQSPEAIFMKALGLEERRNMDPDILKSLEKRESNEPILAVPIVLYDGQRLAIYGEPTEEGKNYNCEAWELRINDQLIGPIEMDDDLGKQDYYIFQTKTDELKLTVPFEVTIPLRVFRGGKRYENQDLTFIVDVSAQPKVLPDQSFSCKEYSVRITDLKQSLTALQGKVTVEMTKEQKKAYEAGNRVISELIFRSGEGTLWKSLGVESSVCSEYSFYCQIPEDDPQFVLMSFMGRRKDLPDVGDIPAGKPVPQEVIESGDRTNPENYYGETIRISLSRT